MLRLFLILITCSILTAQARLPIGYTTVPGNSSIYLSGNHTYEWGYLDVPAGTYTSLSFRIHNYDGNYDRDMNIDLDSADIYLSPGYSISVRPIAERQRFNYVRHRTGPLRITLRQIMPPVLAFSNPELWNIVLDFDTPFYFGGGTLYIKLVTGEHTFSPYRIPIDAMMDPWPADPEDYTYINTYISTRDDSCGGQGFPFPYSSWMYVNTSNRVYMGCNLPYTHISSNELGLLSIGLVRGPLAFTIDNRLCINRIEPLVVVPISNFTAHYCLGIYSEFLTGVTLGSYISSHNRNTGEITRVSYNHYNTFNKVDLTDFANFGSTNLLSLGRVQAPLILLQ